MSAAASCSGWGRDCSATSGGRRAWPLVAKETEPMRVPACALLLLSAAGCDLWETECLREPARCAPRTIGVTPAGALSRTVSDSLSLQIDGPLRETAPRRFQLEDAKGQVLVELGSSSVAPYEFPLAAKQ